MDIDAGNVRGSGSGGGGGRKKYDYECGVTMDTSSGTRTLHLNFNEADDPNTVAQVGYSEDVLSY
jgi:hypothetical protein